MSYDKVRKSFRLKASIYFEHQGYYKFEVFEPTFALGKYHLNGWFGYDGMDCKICYILHMFILHLIMDGIKLFKFT